MFQRRDGHNRPDGHRQPGGESRTDWAKVRFSSVKLLPPLSRRSRDSRNAPRRRESQKHQQQANAHTQRAKARAKTPSAYREGSAWFCSRFGRLASQQAPEKRE